MLTVANVHWVLICFSERALLSLLMTKLHQLDADVLVGHNISGFDLDILLHRLQVLNFPFDCLQQENAYLADC